MSAEFESIEQVQEGLRIEQYIAERSLATSVFLALRLKKPLFLEGEAGVGKTEVAKVLASLLDRRLIRLQCYEGLDVHNAVYEWNYARQLLHIRLLEAAGQVDPERVAEDVFSPRFLLRRPLLEAIDGAETAAPVLLIDELDRADEEFEAFLLEILSDFQVTIPEIGTLRAAVPPVVVITSNRTREVHDALKRRCLYAWIEYPSFEKEYSIVRSKVPDVSERLAAQIVAFVQELRHEDLYKRPGVAETLDWAAGLAAVTRNRLTEEVVPQTLGLLLKYKDDLEHLTEPVILNLLEKARLRLDQAGEGREDP